jgi:hypothetical protein
MLDRKRVLVQDEVTGLAPHVPLTWRMLTATQVAIESPRIAILTQAGRTLKMEILAPVSARFVARQAMPPTAVENQNQGITVIEATLPAATTRRDVRIAVLLTPVGEKWISSAAPGVVALEDWK